MLLVMGTKLKLANRNEEFVRGEHKPLAAGIHNAVLIMRRAGIEPFESHQGGPGHASDMPTIKFRGNALAGYKALMDNGFAVWRVKHVWEVANGQLEGPWWEIVLHSTG